jgi:MOSC domain-containing protein YiiM|tara:strand:- start:2447 stop:2866 length:420 start_codon:yes stop_codon:yes gene_type:complete
LGTITSLAINQGKLKSMSYKNQIEIIKNYGIEGDRFSKLNTSRQIMIVDAKLYEINNLEKGSLRENILVENINLNSCLEGQKILIDDNLEMKITLVKDACASINYNDPEVIKKLKGNMYIFATPINSGVVLVNNKIEII